MNEPRPTGRIQYIMDDFPESRQVKLSTQVMRFRIADTEVTVRIDVSRIGNPVPVTITVDSGSPKVINFPPENNLTTHRSTFETLTPPSTPPPEEK
jgi:hypothetical protein